MLRLAARLVWIACAMAGLGGLACRTPVRSTLTGPPAQQELAELWTAPEPGRDLLHGVGGARRAPDPAARYTVIEVKRTGFSAGYTVKDDRDREWSVKFPPEASTEVVASRILWGAGYHQPPIYYVDKWNAQKAPSPNPQLPARFREKKPDLDGLESDGTWSYYRNPFVGTRPMQGLLVLQVMLGNSDLKDEQNAVYKLEAPLEGARRWYVARDVGQTFGRTGVIEPPRGDIRVYEQTPFIIGVDRGKVQFDYRGRHRPLVANITPADVRWICERLNRFTDRQWQDAFRAGGYAPETAGRFIRRTRQKIAEGLALKDSE